MDPLGTTVANVIHHRLPPSASSPSSNSPNQSLSSIRNNPFRTSSSSNQQATHNHPSTPSAVNDHHGYYYQSPNPIQYHHQHASNHYSYPQTPTQQLHQNYPKSPTPSWPSSPLLKPNLVGASISFQQPVIWPNRSNASTPASKSNHLYHREPRSPIREDPRRSINNNPSTPQSQLHPQSDLNPQPQLRSQPNPSHPNPNQIVHPENSSAPSSSSNPNQADKPQTKIRLTGIERNRRDLYIKFDAWSNLITIRAGHCPNVSRSYREILSFHECLVSNNPHTIVPPVPFPNTSAPSPADDDRLVASAFQQFFDRLLLNPFLRTDDELRGFLESDFGYAPHTKPKRRTIGSGSGWLSKPAAGATVRTLPSSSVNQQGNGAPDTVVSVVEEDELSNAKLQFRLLEDKLIDCCRSVEHLSRSKRSLAQALSELSNRITQFSTTESHGALAEGFRKLGQTIRSTSELESNSSIGYLVTLSDGLSWCSVSAKAAKEVLRNRAGVLQEHYSCVKKSIEKRRLIERIKSNTLNVSSERVESALDELEEAKKAEEIIAQKAMLISTNLRPSLRSHSELLHDDLLYCLLENARTQLIYEKQILKEFERLKPDLDSISLKPANVIYGSSLQNQSSTHNGSSSINHHHQNPLNSNQDINTHQDSIRGGAGKVDESRGGESMRNKKIHQDAHFTPSSHHPPLSSSSSTIHQYNSGGGGGGIINSQHIQPTPVRVSEISKHLVVHNQRGENIDGRQRVDAKSAAASLARLF